MPQTPPAIIARVRQTALHEADKIAKAAGFKFCLSAHFLERINVRAPNENTFINLVRCVKSMTTKPVDKFVSMMVGDESFLMVNDGKNITAISFCIFFKPDHWRKSDIQIRLLPKEPDL